MEMEFVNLVKVLVRWSWLIILIVVATALVLYFNPNLSLVDYQADVTLLLTTPDREDVNIMDDYVFTSDRDEVTIAVNKFLEIAQYPEVRERTMLELGIDEEYGLTVEAELGADFVYITVSASDPELAAEIANVHAENAIQYYGEIRALGSTHALIYLDEEILAAEQALRDAETALSSFQTEHNVVLLDSEIQLQYDVLEELEVARASLLVAQATGGLNLNSAVGGVDPVLMANLNITEIDALIDAQRLSLANLSELEPEYNRLQEDVDRAQAHYDFLRTQSTNVETRASLASQAMFIQVVEAASVPVEAEDNTFKTMAIGIAGSLGFAILLVFLLDYLFKKW